jgi:tRNA/rRNA methyltransferase
MRVANEFPVPFQAAKSAVDASDVLAGAVTYDSVAEAVADCTLVIGTTSVGERDLQHELFPLSAAAPKMLAELRRDGDSGRVALLFGSEKTGLSNEELSHCNWLLTIPMHEHSGVRHPSMNLGQAVAVCLYELVRTPAHGTVTASNLETAASPAAAANLERITTLLLNVMEKTEYTRRHAHNCDPAHVRRLVRRIGMDAVDAPVWLGILKQIMWKLTGKRED